MSSYVQPKMKTFKAGGAIKKHCFVKFGASDEHVLESDAGEKAFGVNMGANNADAATGDDVEVAHLGGGALVKLAGTVTRGDSIASDADGKGVVATDGQWSPAIALASGVAGDVISVLLNGHFAVVGE